MNIRDFVVTAVALEMKGLGFESRHCNAVERTFTGELYYQEMRLYRGRVGQHHLLQNKTSGKVFVKMTSCFDET